LAKKLAPPKERPLAAKEGIKNAGMGAVSFESQLKERIQKRAKEVEAKQQPQHQQAVSVNQRDDAIKLETKKLELKSIENTETVLTKDIFQQAKTIEIVKSIPKETGSISEDSETRSIKSVDSEKLPVLGMHF
jgi:hypothetical protein